MFDDTPSVLIPGWTSDDTTISFARAGFPKLSAAEANTSTGDSRKVLYALLHKIHANYAALATADRPAKMVIVKSEGSPASGTQRVVFTFQFDLDISDAEVAAE